MDFTVEKFFFDTPIYNAITIKEEEWNEFIKIDDLDNTFEGYNPWKKIQSTFQISRSLSHYHRDYFNEGGHAELRIKCKRYGDEFRYFILWIPEKSILVKIGQFPSVADFHINEVKQYKKLLSDNKLKEFTKAIGLAANGVGIGSFVYLRRIFESLISEAFSQAESDGVISNGDFQKARMEDKIDLLSEYLPTFLVENKSMYSILSLGIHELDEQTCLAHFDTLRVGIEIILDEKLDELRKKEKIEEAKKKLEQLKEKIKK
ncbi:MAG: hypothetical protein JZU47_10690 [Prolixibacteraceae bacterium]|nr:hypothetical protein [Prolixibacteraceae bacterium]